jgi:hypothetical protein
MRIVILAACAGLALLAFYWEGSDARRAPGVLVPYEPEQNNLARSTPWLYRDTKVTPLAEFRIRARVLLTNHYWWGREASVSPVDLTLGWRLMSNQEVLDGLHLYSLSRAYAWSGRNGRLPAAADEIATHSANMHMVPATPAIAERLRSIHRGDVIDLRGYLVEIAFPNGGIWRSSLTRNDTGNGACELVWVEDLTQTGGD